jgi:hypothetical protein
MKLSSPHYRHKGDARQLVTETSKWQKLRFAEWTVDGLVQVLSRPVWGSRP